MVWIQEREKIWETRIETLRIRAKSSVVLEGNEQNE